MINEVRNQDSPGASYGVAEILDYWDALLRIALRKPSYRKWAWAAVHYACPPPNYTDFTHAVYLYCQDHPHQVNELSQTTWDAVDSGMARHLIPECINIRQSWIVYVRMRDLGNKVRGRSEAEIAAARRQFRAMLAPGSDRDKISASKFYNDVNDLDRHWRNLLNSSVVGNWCAEDFWNELRGQTLHYPSESDERHTPVLKALEFFDQFRFRRTVGVPSKGALRNAAVQGDIGNSTRLARDASALQTEPAKTIRSKAPDKCRAPSSTKAASYRSERLKSTEQKIARQQTDWHARETSDATQPWSDTQLTKLPESTRHSVRRQGVVLRARSALKNISDVHRLTPEALKWCINQIEAAEDVMFIVLLLLGWSPRAAENLRIDQSAFAAVHDDVPVYAALAGTLSLPVKGSGEQGVSHRIDLIISGPLKKVMDQLMEDYPLSGSRDRLNKRWKTNWPSNCGGLQPTCDRVRAGGWLLLRALCESELQAQAFSGQLDFANTVSMAYRRIEPMVMQSVFEAWLRDLNLGGGASQVMNVHLGARPAPALGSRCQLQWPMVRRLRRTMDHQIDRYARLVKTATADRQHVLVNTYLELLWGQFYLALMLISAGRPWGTATVSRITARRYWVREKSSKSGEESRMLPIPEALIEAVTRLNQWAVDLRNQTRESITQINNNRLALAGLPRFSSKLRDVRFQPYSNSTFRRTLATILDDGDPIVEAFDEYNNALRHLVATTSQSELGFYHANALMGHQRGFDANTHPSSFEPFNRVENAISTFQQYLLSWGGFQPQTPMPVSELLKRPLP